RLGRLPVERVLDDVVGLDERRAFRVREEEALGRLGIAHADVAIGIDHVFVGQYAICDDKFGDEVHSGYPKAGSRKRTKVYAGEDSQAISARARRLVTVGMRR